MPWLSWSEGRTKLISVGVKNGVLLTTATFEGSEVKADQSRFLNAVNMVSAGAQPKQFLLTRSKSTPTLLRLLEANSRLFLFIKMLYQKASLFLNILYRPFFSDELSPSKKLFIFFPIFSSSSCSHSSGCS